MQSWKDPVEEAREIIRQAEYLALYGEEFNYIAPPRRGGGEEEEEEEEEDEDEEGAEVEEGRDKTNKVGSNQKEQNLNALEAIPGPSTSNSLEQPVPEKSMSSGYNIQRRLLELYVEEKRDPNFYGKIPQSLRKHIKRGSNLLPKLVKRDNLNTLIINLYPGNKGYSVSVRAQGGVPAAPSDQPGPSRELETLLETSRMSYSNDHLLRCIDRQELPAHILDLVDECHPELWYGGCLIAEIRDYRPTFPLSTFKTSYVLLKPTTQSMIADTNVMSADLDLDEDAKLRLESKIVEANATPLCLDPNPGLLIATVNTRAKRHPFITEALIRASRKFSQVAVNRKRKLDQFTNHNTLPLYDFISKRKAKMRAAGQGKQMKKPDGRTIVPPPVPSEEVTPLAPPSVEPDVFKYAKHYEKTKETTDCSVHLIEEYILETERAQGRIYRIKLTILQRHSNLEYLGELYVDRDYKEGERSGASCRFVLGTRVHANRYIQQFTEIFTEEGRKSVRITHVVPGQQHRVSYTPGMRERNAAHNLIKQDRNKLCQGVSAATQGKQATSLVNNSQNPLVPCNSQHASLPSSHIEISPSGTINFNLNSQQIQKLHGQLSTTNANVLTQNSSSNSTIQINSVSHLTSLLTNSNVAAPPNVNVQQIQHGQNVIGIASQSTASLGQQGRNVGQNIVNVHNIGINSQNINNSTIQSLLTNALNSNLTEDITGLQDGPISSGNCVSQSAIINSSNVTMHHPPSQSQVPVTKPSRSPLATNPAISALVTSLMNSAQQFQVQQAAQQAANNSSNPNVQSNSTNFITTSSSSTSQNPTILSLLNASTHLNIPSNSTNSNIGSNNNPTNNGNTTTTNSNSVSSTNVNLNQQSQQKHLTRNITNLLNSRLLNQNLGAAVNSSVSNPTLVVNNSSQQPLRVTFSSLNQFMGASNPNAGTANQTPQILNLGNVNSPSSTGFAAAATQGGITLPTQSSNLTTQSFTLSNTSSPTFTITTQNAQNQTYSISAHTIGSMPPTQNQTFTLAPNTGSLSSQSFTISPANTNALNNSGFSISQGNSSKDFTAQSSQNSGSQTQTFTVLQQNQTLGNQSFTITAPVVTVGSQGFTVTNPQAAVGNQAFTITSRSVSPVTNKTFQISNPGTTNHTFTISTPLVTVANQFVNSQSTSSQNFSGHAPGQKFVLNTPTTQTTSSNVFTVSSVPNQVFTVNIPSTVSSHSTNFNSSFASSSQMSQSKNVSNQSSVLINKNQTFTINANNQSFASLISNNQNFSSLTKNSDGILSGSSNSTASNDNSGNKISGNSNSPACSAIMNRNSTGRIAACQRKLSNALQQVNQNNELNKLLSERSDTILLTESSPLFNDKSESTLNENSKLNQIMNEKKPTSEGSKLSQALSGNVDGTNSPGTTTSHTLSSASNLGLSMPGLSALLAGTPSADNPIPGASNSSSLLERLASSAPNSAFTSPPLPTAPQSPNISSLSPSQNLNFQNSTYATSSNNSAFNSVNSNSPLSTIASPSVPNFTSSSPKSQMQFQSSSPNSKEILGMSSPLSSPPGATPVSLNLQGLSLQGIPGLQNVQVSIPGLAVPISLSLNVSGQPGNTQGVIMTSLSVAPTTNTNTTTTSGSTMVLTNAGSSSNTGSILPIPVAPLIPPQGTKSGNQRLSTSSSTQRNPQSIQLVSSLQRPCRPSTNQIQGSKGMQSIASRGLINTQKGLIKNTGNSQIAGSLTTTGLGNQVLTLTAQQQLQLALQKQAQMQQCYNQQNQKRPVSPSSVANKHRRRSNAADSNK